MATLYIDHITFGGIEHYRGRLPNATAHQYRVSDNLVEMFKAWEFNATGDTRLTAGAIADAMDEEETDKDEVWELLVDWMRKWFAGELNWNSGRGSWTRHSVKAFGLKPR